MIAAHTPVAAAGLGAPRGQAGLFPHPHPHGRQQPASPSPAAGPLGHKPGVGSNICIRPWRKGCPRQMWISLFINLIFPAVLPMISQRGWAGSGSGAARPTPRPGPQRLPVARRRSKPPVRERPAIPGKSPSGSRSSPLPSERGSVSQMTAPWWLLWMLLEPGAGLL